jgi:RNA recognition motif-containing protein
LKLHLRENLDYLFKGIAMRYRTLYVGNLLASATPGSLQEHFAEYGGVNARIVARHGFGFVDVLEEFAASAIKEMNQSLYQGHRLTVVEAEEAATGIRSRSPAINLIAEETMGDSFGTHRAS